MNSSKISITLEQLQRVFTANEHPKSTLTKIDRKLSENLHGFLNEEIVASDFSLNDIESCLQDFKFPEDPILVSSQTDFLLKNVIKKSVHTSSPTFIGHMTSALPYFMLPLSRLMIALNQNLVKIETSKAFTPLERQVLAMMHNLIYSKSDGFYEKMMFEPDQALGVACSGGTVANITAMWIARNKLLCATDSFGGVESDGILSGCKAHGFTDLAIVCSELAHYSIAKCAGILGLGRKNIRKIPCDAHGSMRVDLLDQEIKKLRRSGTGIVSVVGLAGSTEIGSVDDLNKISEICKEHKLHFHVDGAWGGPVLLSEAHKEKLNGIENADTVTIDAHKQLYCPMGVGYCIFKSPEDATEIRTSANYIIRAGSKDLGKFSLEGSRPGMSILVQSAFKILGRSGYEMLVNNGISLAEDFAKMILESEDFELVSKPHLNILTYRWWPKKLRKFQSDQPLPDEIKWALNKVTIFIQKNQRDQGKSFVSRTTLNFDTFDQTTVFRVVLANPLTTREILREVLAEQRQIGRNIPSV